MQVEDEEYRRKIKDRSYSPQDANHWVKEINGFLKWIIEKNPGMSLEEMLREQGVSQSNIEGFIKVLRDTHLTAAGMSGHGVNPEIVKTLEALMKTLGVSTWLY